MLVDVRTGDLLKLSSEYDEDSALGPEYVLIVRVQEKRAEGLWSLSWFSCRDNKLEDITLETRYVRHSCFSYGRIVSRTKAET